MRIETIQIKIAKFNELNEEQKNKVLEKYHDINVDNDYWYEGVKDDFHSILELLGFSVNNSFFTGFWSQGDGASFEAFFKIPENKKELKNRLKKLKEYAPKYLSKELENDFLSLDFKEWLKDGENHIEIIQRGNYYHEYTMQCDHDALLEFSRNLAAKYYKDLESQYNYLTSSEAIIETIENNDYEFNLDTLKIY
jgi:hypothetical protein